MQQMAHVVHVPVIPQRQPPSTTTAPERKQNYRELLLESVLSIPLSWVLWKELKISGTK